jgi:signal transduction histidine kinase
VLGLRAVRAERIEREQQLREHRAQVSHLASAAIANAIAELEGELRHADESSQALSGLILLSLDHGGRITFLRDRVYFGEPALLDAPSGGWGLSTELLIEQARAAEAQQRGREAETAYRKLILIEPKLRDWAELSLARVRHQSGDGGAEDLLAGADWSRSQGLTPAGLPVALVASAYVERLADYKRARFVPLLEETIKSLRGGRWLLSYDQRRLYDEELRRLLESAGARALPVEDDRLDELAEIVSIVRKTPPFGHDKATRIFERSDRAAYLILWSGSSPQTGARMGLAVGGPQLEELLDRTVAPILSGQPFTAAIRDAQGNVLWGASSDISQTETLRAMAGWEMVFSPPLSEQWIDEKQLLWVGFVLLLVLMLVAGLAMTARVMRREMELARLQSEFLAAVSHEFKSPLTSIRLLMERITSGRLRSAQDAGEYYAAIDRETARLERLVYRLLEAQAIQVRRKRYNFELVSIVEIADTAFRQLGPQAEAKNIRLEAITEDDIPKLQLDKVAIEDAIKNLLDNAIKYSPPGSTVMLAIRAVGSNVCLDVIDEGIGIDRDDLPRIFDRFYRGRRGDRQESKGTGLGLALVKASVEAHGGTIDVTSTPGKGSRFRVRLSAPTGGENNGARTDS